jgi:hypothetical protein
MRDGDENGEALFLNEGNDATISVLSIRPPFIIHIFLSQKKRNFLELARKRLKLSDKYKIKSEAFSRRKQWPVSAVSFHESIGAYRLMCTGNQRSFAH